MLITSLLAAAALSVPAYADLEIANTTKDITDASELSGVLQIVGANNQGATVANILVSTDTELTSIEQHGVGTDSGNGSDGTINIGDATHNVVVVAGRVEMGDLNNSKASNLNVVSGSTLIITGTNNDVSPSDRYKSLSLLLGEWNSKTTLNVSGTMLAQGATAFAGDTGMTLNISGGTLAVKGIGIGNSAKTPSSSLSISGNGKLILGDAGISHASGTWSSNLGEGTIGLSSAETTIATNLNFTDATTGTTFDTTQYAFSGEGAAQTISQGTTGGTIKITGTLSGSGIVKVAGSGALDLSGATVSLSSAIQNSATVTVNSNTIFVLSDSLKVADTDNTYSLISGGTINGWNAETLSVTNFRRADGKYLSARSTINFSSAGSVTITGEAYNLFWKSGVTAWNFDTEFDKDSAGSGTTSTFETFDNVTFSTGNVTVTVAEDGVTAGTVTIASGTVEFRSGKVTAQDGFFVGDGVSEDDSTAKLVLSSNNALCGDVTVNKGGTFDLNAQSDSMSSDETNPNRIGKIVLNGGSLTSTGGSQGTNACQIYNLEVTADSKIIGGGTFGILGRGYDPTTLDLGANTLTKSGVGSFVLVRTTISGNGGVLDVTQGKILGHGNYALTLGEGVTLKTSGTGFAENIKIASMGANSKLILGGSGSTASTVALNSFALGTGAVIDVSGANAVTGTLTSMGAGSSLTLAGTGASAVTLSGNIGANANVSVASGSSLTGTDGTTISVGAGSTLSSAGTVSMHRLTLSNTSSATVTGGTFTVSNEEEGLYVCGGATFTVEGGVATVGRLVLNSAGSPSDASANVSVTGGVLNVTRATAHGVVLGSYASNQPQVISVSGDGVFNANCAITMQYTSDGEINVSGNGEMNVKGLAFGIDGKTTAGTVNVTGGRLNIGSSGITSGTSSSGTRSISFSNATIGALDSWSSASVLGITLGGTVTFDTTKMVASTTGKSSVDATDTEGTTITLNGVLSGDGALKKAGAGTLTLTNANTYTGGTVIEAGTVVAAHANAL
ncbi:MAG: beta strand repeat-containing protein, partial [Candidatus Spyradosoma sp.]